MNNNKNKVKSGKKQNKLNKTRKNRGVGRNGFVTQSINGKVNLPTRFPRPVGDIVAMNMGASYPLINTAGATASYLFVYGYGTSTAQYKFLNDVISGFSNLANCYSRFIITDLEISAFMVTPLTGGGVVHVNYEPSSSGTASPPTSSPNVSNSVHYAVGIPGERATIKFNASEYYNDWRTTYNDGNNETVNEQGVTQVFCTNDNIIGSLVAYVDIRCRILFAGYRQ